MEIDEAKDSEMAVVSRKRTFRRYSLRVLGGA